MSIIMAGSDIWLPACYFIYRINVSKYDNQIYECITYYVYAYQLRCTKQDVLRTSKLLPKVMICINIIRYTQPNIYSMF